MISTMQPINTQKITEGELLKAACCNLSEAFETNPTINVAYKDAVTGAKEIPVSYTHLDVYKRQEWGY